MKTSIRKHVAYFENWVDPVAEEILGKRDDIALHRLHYAHLEQENWAILKKVHGYQIAPRGELKDPWFGDGGLISRCPMLLAITSTGSGYDMIDVDACTDAGIIVCSQTGSNRNAVAEHALALMLGLVKRIGYADKAMRKTPNLDRFEYRGSDLHGKTVGLVGLGEIGSRTAELCAAFGTNVIAFDPYQTAEKIAVRGGRKVDFQELLQQSDIVSVHCPRTKETLNMFGAAEFALMKQGAYFVSTARGGIHDEEALHAALGSGHLAGAGVDVFLNEPPSLDHALLQSNVVIATPHTAGLSLEALKMMATYAADQWISIFNGDAPPRLINPQAWPKYRERFQEILGFKPNAL